MNHLYYFKVDQTHIVISSTGTLYSGNYSSQLYIQVQELMSYMSLDAACYYINGVVGGYGKRISKLEGRLLGVL